MMIRSDIRFKFKLTKEQIKRTNEYKKKYLNKIIEIFTFDHFVTSYKNRKCFMYAVGKVVDIEYPYIILLRTKSEVIMVGYEDEDGNYEVGEDEDTMSDTANNTDVADDRPEEIGIMFCCPHKIIIYEKNEEEIHS